MSRWRRWSLTVLFFLTFAFLGGGLFLLYGMLPLEKWLVGAGWKQGEIDRFLTPFVAGWFVIAAAIAWVYHRVTLAPKWRRSPALISVAATTLGAMALFYAFLNTNFAIIASRAAGIEELEGGKLTFGPYPDREQMLQLKAQGIDGIIALLNRTVPFEGPLLDQEIANAKEVGIELHVLPMLPWVSENRESLEQARGLLSQRDRRYYVHCYLGRHRTNLIRALAAQMDAPTELQAALQSSLERGPLLVYEKARILVGPYPTDEEWLGKILNHGVREVISVIPRDTPEDSVWVEKMKKIGATYGVTVVERPLHPTFPDEKAVREVADYAKSRPYKVFIVGFRDGNWTWAVDTALGGRGFSTPEELKLEKLERGKLLRAGPLFFGPLPTDEELDSLRRAGITEFVSLIDPADPKNQPWMEKEQQWSRIYGFKLTHMPIPRRSYSAADIQSVSDYLQSRKTPVYVHGFTADVRVEILHRLAERFPHVVAATNQQPQTAPGPANAAPGAAAVEPPQKR